MKSFDANRILDLVHNDWRLRARFSKLSPLSLKAGTRKCQGSKRQRRIIFQAYRGPLSLLDFRSIVTFLGLLSSHIHGALNGSLLIDGAFFSCGIRLDIVGFEMLHCSSSTTSCRVSTRTVSTTPLLFSCICVEILCRDPDQAYGSIPRWPAVEYIT